MSKNQGKRQPAYENLNKMAAVKNKLFWVAHIQYT